MHKTPAETFFVAQGEKVAPGRMLPHRNLLGELSEELEIFLVRRKHTIVQRSLQKHNH